MNSNFFDPPASPAAQRAQAPAVPAAAPVQHPAGAAGPSRARKVTLADLPSRSQSDPRIALTAQNKIHTILQMAFSADPSIKDFIIHEGQTVHVACARGKLPLTEIITGIPELEEPITRDEIQLFVVVYLMGPVASKEQASANQDRLAAHLADRPSYSDSMRLSWGSKIRISLFRQSKGKWAMVGRVSSLLVTPLDKVGIPHQAVSAIRQAQRGLILITGPMSSGKTSTAQSILNHRNMHGNGHIMTVEDPIETTLSNERCLITTKEVGADVPSFLQGLTDALRQAVDVLFIGELRDPDTIKAAISAAGSGMLVIATVHGDTCGGALTRMMSMLGDEAPGYWKVLSTSLITVIRQALVPTADGTSWQVAADALINSDTVSAIMSGESTKIEQHASGPTKGNDWISMNDMLRQLVTNKRVLAQDALRETTDVKSLRSSLPPR